MATGGPQAASGSRRGGREANGWWPGQGGHLEVREVVGL